MKKEILTLMVICLVLAMLPISAYATPPVDLGAAASFGVLGGQAVTNTGSTVINGDLGIWPNGASSITGFYPIDGGPGIVNGTIHAGDTAASEAQDAVTAAYISLAGITVYTDFTSTPTLGGRTLTSGVYHFDAAADLTGVLTLNAEYNSDAYFVFQIGSALTTATDSSVVMMNAPENFCNKYWQVDTATLGTGTEFIGNILALTSITLNGGTLDGRALARTGAVTISTAEMITVPCVIPEPATICLLGLGALGLIRKKRA
jgi:hypothetical protein